MPAFTDEQLTALLLGREVDCTSSNVQVAQYHDAAQEFIVGFGRPGDAQLNYYVYESVPEELVRAFAAAPSQGVYVSAAFVKTRWPFRKGVGGLTKLYRQSAV